MAQTKITKLLSLARSVPSLCVSRLAVAILYLERRYAPSAAFHVHAVTLSVHALQANESKSQRGMLRLRADARAAEAADAKTVPQAV